MDFTKIRVINLDDDTVEIKYVYNKKLNKYFGNYPDFSETPRYTPNGKPWVNATYIDCPYSTEHYDDCGSCTYFCREKPFDLIGICLNPKNFKITPREEHLL